MNKRKVFLLLQSALCLALALLLAAAALGIYREGLAEKAQNPLAPVYTAERIAERARVLLPLLLLTAGLALTGILLRIRDEDGLRPVKTGAMRSMARPAGEKALRILLLLAALGLITLGVFNGSARDVLGKAIKICTECIGLG